MPLCLSLFILSFANSTANILQNDQLFVLIMMKMCMMPAFPHQQLYVESFIACQQTRIYYDLNLLWITCSLCDTIYVLLFSVKLTASMSISCLWPNDYRNDYFVKGKCIVISFHQNNRALAGLVLSCLTPLLTIFQLYRGATAISANCELFVRYVMQFMFDCCL
jgi:hypothetical protein